MKLFEKFRTSVALAAAHYKELQENKIIRLSALWSLFFAVISILILVIVFQRLPPVVPLWFSRPWGEERLAHPLWLFVLPGGALLWIAATVEFCLRFTKEHLVFSQILFLSIAFVSLLSLATTAMIVWIIL
jgi:hypothetical protein